MTDEAWADFKKDFYKSSYLCEVEGGAVYFSENSMQEVKNLPRNTTYDEYLEIQRNSLGHMRSCFEACYADGAITDFRGRIAKKDSKRHRVLFLRIAVDAERRSGDVFSGWEEHVWIEDSAFADFSVGDNVSFHGDVYRYYRIKDGTIDYAVGNPSFVEKIDNYEVPTEEEMLAQAIDSLVCETCLYSDHCYGHCIANEEERLAKIALLKSVSPNGVTPATVATAHVDAL